METTRSRAIEEAQKQTLGKLANIDHELKHSTKDADGKMIFEFLTTKFLTPVR